MTHDGVGKYVHPPWSMPKRYALRCISLRARGSAARVRTLAKFRASLRTTPVTSSSLSEYIC